MNEEGLQDTPNKLIHIGKPIDFDMEKFEHHYRNFMRSQTGIQRVLRMQ